MVKQQSQDNNQTPKKIAKSFVSGGFAGICAKTLIAPIQRVKYLFITSNRSFSYRSFFNDFMYIVNTHGTRNLWRGNTMNILRVFPSAAIDFSVFDYLRGRFYFNQQGSKAKLILFLCGAAAGICSMTATIPIEFIRLRLAMEKNNFSYAGNLNAFKKVYTLQGFIGFYRGYAASILGVVIYHGFSFYIFTSLKELVKKHYPQLYKKWYMDFILGGISSGGQIFAYPLDILRKRMQGQYLLLQRKQITKIMNYRELIDSIFTQEKGFRGFYKGISLNLIKAPLASATSWTVKNGLNRKLDKGYDL